MRNPPTYTATLKSQTFAGLEGSGPRLDEQIAFAKRHARRKGALETTVFFRLGEGLSLTAVVLDRGKTFKVPGHGLFALTVDGVLKALADVVRVDHNADSHALDLYAELLEAQFTD